MNKFLSILISILLIVSLSDFTNADKCSKWRNAFYCAVAGVPCFWRADGKCIEIRSKPHHLEEIEMNENTACSFLSSEICQVSKDIGCKWENNECTKEESTKDFCESIKGKLTCVLSNCQWSDNHCHY